MKKGLGWSRTPIGFFMGWFIFCALLSLASLGGLAYAIYWALSIAETAVGG